MKTISRAVSVMVLMALLQPAAVAAGAQASDYTLIRTKQVAPDYPRLALKREREGWVDVQFTVSPNGEVENVEIIAAEPRRLFERAALRAASKWEFAAPANDGVSSSQTGVFRLIFAIN